MTYNVFGGTLNLTQPKPALALHLRPQPLVFASCLLDLLTSMLFHLTACHAWFLQFRIQARGRK